LQDLNMYGNKLTEITIPRKPGLLSKLEILNLGYNDLAYLPDDLDHLKALRVLKVMDNFLERVPMRVCDMDLRSIDVSNNPVIQPPIETCERGIAGMKRYYQCLCMEQQFMQRKLADVQSKKGRKAAPATEKKPSLGLKNVFSIPATSSAVHRKGNEDVPPPAVQAASVDAVGITQPGGAVTPADKVSTSLTSFALSTPPFAMTASQQRQEGLETLTLATLDTPDPKRRTVDVDQIEREAAVGEAYNMESSAHGLDAPKAFPPDPMAVNDTLKVIFVGMARVGKTSMIRRLIEGKDAEIPTHDERTVGVDIYEWDPKRDRRFGHIDSTINFQDVELASTMGDVDVKFSMWDFAGQHVYHATHKLFFSPRALYVLVWDMGATNHATTRRKSVLHKNPRPFSLLFDLSDDESSADEKMEHALEEEARRADRELERDIDEKVQFWVDCIQSTAPGAAILPVASFADYFAKSGGEAEAKRRCNFLKQRLLHHQELRIKGIRQRLQEYYDQNRPNDQSAIQLRKLLCDYSQPKLIFGEEDSVVRVSGTQCTGFERLAEKIVGLATGKEKAQYKYPIYRGHVGARIPRVRLVVREVVRELRDRFEVIEWGYLVSQLRSHGLTNECDINDTLHFLTNIGELSYFGGVFPDSKGLLNPEIDAPGDGKTCGTRIENPEVAQDRDHDAGDGDDDHDEMDDEGAWLSVEDASITAPATQGSITTFDNFMYSGLSQFVFLNPRWLVAAVACILRHDLDREIKETSRQVAGLSHAFSDRGASSYDAHLNCPVVTAADALILWQAKWITKKGADRAQQYSYPSNMTVSPFDFLQQLLVRFGLFN
jgi:GTPase SAR1 family protein